METWINAAGFDRYEVSDLGRVRNKNGRILKQKLHRQGYFEIGLYDAPKTEGGRQRYVLVHALVLSSFGRTSEQGEVCRHLDGDPGNNLPSNLKWGTQAENFIDSVEHGTADLKLTEPDVLEIRRIYSTRKRGDMKRMAERFGVCPRSIWACATGRTYNWIKESL